MKAARSAAFIYLGFCPSYLKTHIPLVMEGDKQLRNRHREEIVALASRRKEI
jgi:hypothetical protein